MINQSWVWLGFVGQGFFASRFLVQWVISEMRQKSVVPVVFWQLSLIGGMLLLTYAILRRDPVFIVGQASGLLVYTRNLILIRRKRSRLPGSPGGAPPPPGP